jgi:hypothetical protein
MIKKIKELPSNAEIARKINEIIGRLDTDSQEVTGPTTNWVEPNLEEVAKFCMFCQQPLVYAEETIVNDEKGNVYHWACRFARINPETDSSLVYYGPHPCKKCGEMIVKAGNGRPDYLEFDFVQDSHYPNHVWKYHQHNKLTK